MCSVLREVQALLDEGFELPEIANRLGLLTDTLRKALRAGKLHNSLKKTNTVLQR